MTPTVCRSRTIVAMGLLVVCFATVMSARQSPALADLFIFEFFDLGAPRSDGVVRLRATNRSNQTLTIDVAFYRGDPRSGDATEIARASVTMGPHTPTGVSSPPLVFSEGDIFGVCLDPDGQIVESNRHNNCDTRTSPRRRPT